jgi:hypothetical protein
MSDTKTLTNELESKAFLKLNPNGNKDMNASVGLKRTVGLVSGISIILGSMIGLLFS